jgi:cell division protein FtsB
MRIVTLILFVVLILLQFKLWLGEGGYTEVKRLQLRVDAQRQQNDEMLQRNAQLQAEVEDLRDRLDAVEERARNELGLIKQDEKFYQVVPPPPQNKNNGNNQNGNNGEG